MLKISPGGLAKALVDTVKGVVADGAHDAFKAVTGIDINGDVPIRGYHCKMAKAPAESVAAVIVEQGPPLSSLAASVKRTGDVTSYDITPGVGPKFAWKPAGASTFEVAGQTVTVLEMNIGDDAATGAKSSYDGKSFLVLGNGFAAEAWIGAKADGLISEFLAESGHNLIVDGILLNRNGFRGVARSAKDVDPSHAKEVLSKLPAISTPDALVQFVAAKPIPGLSEAARSSLINQLQTMPPADKKYVGEAVRREALPAGPSTSFVGVRNTNLV